MTPTRGDAVESDGNGPLAWGLGRERLAARGREGLRRVAGARLSPSPGEGSAAVPASQERGLSQTVLPTLGLDSW